MNAEVIHGDCLEVMRTMDADSVHAIVTDPPYGLSFMGKDWDHGIPGVAFWTEALRVAKPGAHILAFGGTRTFHRLTCAIEDAGWEIRDCLSWLYGSGFPKSHNLHGEWEGWGTALKPAWEPIILARKPIEGTVAANVLKHGCGGLNIDGGRVGAEPWSRSTPYKDNIKGGRLHAGKGAETYEVGPQHGNTLGRWPANVMLEDGAIDADWTRYFYCAKASKRDRDEGLEGMPEIVRANGNKWTDQDYRVSRGERPPSAESGPRKNHHPTVKPTDLMRYLCRLVTPPNGTVLDPFCGSGSTGKAAVLEGFNFIGIEREAEYVAIARARIAAANKEPALIAGAA